MLACALVCLMSVSVVGPAQLPSGSTCQANWRPTFGGEPGLDDTVRALAVYDDGSGGGPALVAGGEFSAAGGVAASYVAKWDGSGWSALGSGMNASVRAVTVFDDGSGGGPELYAGGLFTTAGGVAAKRIAKWDGSSWSTLGTGMSHAVNALSVYDDGNGGGPALFAGGEFLTAGGGAANRVAKWNGASWSALGSGTDSWVYALAAHDDGSGGGTALYAGGIFTTAGGGAASRVAKWDGAGWSALAGGTSGDVETLVEYDDGGGPELYAGGTFVTAGLVPAEHVARWDGASWWALGSEMDGDVLALAAHDDGGGGGPALYAGGDLTTTGGGPGNRIARWNGSAWSALGGGIGSTVNALSVYDDGSGPAPYAGGFFTTAGGIAASRIAKWDGASWSTLGSGTDLPVNALAVHDDGGGAALYAGGSFNTAGAVVANHIAKWDGTSWSTLASGMTGWVFALAAHDDGGGPALYAGGDFTTAGGVAARRIAKWDGTSWSPLGSGILGAAYALTTHDDGGGSGPALYMGGVFFSAGGVPAKGVARWDGTSWSALGSGTNGAVRALAVYDDGGGGGPALFAGGSFTTASGVAANRIAKWNGTSWSILGSGMNGDVRALAVHDDGGGGGPVLYAGGEFTTAGGVAANRIAKWDGASWSAVGSGMDDAVRALAVHGGGWPALYAGGEFTVSPCGDSYLAEWTVCAGTLSYCTPGTSAAGCQATLSASGTPSAGAASGFDLLAADVEGNKDGLFFFGTSGRQANPWGNGTSYQCVVPPVKRGGLLAGTGTTGACDGSFAQDLNARWNAKPNQNPGPGAIVQAQLWYRDPFTTSNQTTGLSDALEFAVGP